MSHGSALAPLSSVPFRFLLAGRLVATTGNAIAPIALAFAVLDLGGSASELGLVLASRTVPMVVLVLFGGVVADRLPRHLVVVAANSVSAGTQAVVAVLLFTGSADIVTLAALEAVNGASTAFLYPAASGLTPQTVPASQLQPANALLRLAHNAAMVTGSAGGGILVAAVGSSWAFAADAMLYAVGAVLLACLRLPRRATVATTDVLHELRDGWHEFRSRTWLWVIVVQFSLVNAGLACAFATLGPVVADQSVGRAVWGLVLAAQTLGMVVGGLLALRARWSRPLFAGTAAVLLTAPVLFVLGLGPQTHLLLLAAFVGGVGMETFAIAWDVSVQSSVPAERLSRVYAYDWFGSLVFIPVGQAAAGPLSAAVGVDATIVGAGVLLVVCTVGALCVRSVRTLQRVEPLDSEQVSRAPVSSRV